MQNVVTADVNSPLIVSLLKLRSAVIEIYHIWTLPMLKLKLKLKDKTVCYILKYCT